IVRRVNPNDNPEKWGLQLLKQLVAEIEIMSGLFYFKNEKNIFESASTYAYPLSIEPYSFAAGEGITGQVAKNKQISVYRSIPEDYKEVFSGLGKEKPSYLAIIPILIEDVTIAVIEIAGFKWSDEKLEQLFQIIARGLSEKIQENNE
ncbi:MAG: GAF domain-containing protein, partial [Bacteroidales bacterium]|nr:GAF domain-containing protein [Bacteroidales bacterium]